MCTQIEPSDLLALKRWQLDGSTIPNTHRIVQVDATANHRVGNQKGHEHFAERSEFVDRQIVWLGSIAIRSPEMVGSPLVVLNVAHGQAANLVLLQHFVGEFPDQGFGNFLGVAGKSKRRDGDATHDKQEPEDEVVMHEDLFVANRLAAGFLPRSYSISRSNPAPFSWVAEILRPVPREWSCRGTLVPGSLRTNVPDGICVTLPERLMSERPALSKGEMEVARVLWEVSPAEVREVYERLVANRKIEQATVQTYLRRLEKKGYATSKLRGRARVYTAKARPRTVIRQTVDDLVQRLFGGETMPLVRHLIEERDINSDELLELKQLIDRLEKDGDRS